METATRPELAQDVSCPEITVTLAGEPFRLRFDHAAMRRAELYAADTTGRWLNYLALLNAASARSYAGLAAVLYGAIDPAQGLTAEAFEWRVTMQDCLDCYDAVMQAAFDALPDVAGVRAKNAPRQTQRSAIRGGG